MADAPYYLGLSATMHDPAVALLDEGGNILFAEALERPLQDKRAWNQPPDHMVLARHILETHCPPHATLHVGISWSQSLRNRLRFAAASRLPLLNGWLGRIVEQGFARRDHLVWPAASYGNLLRSLGNSVEQAGVNLKFLGLGGNVEPAYFDHHLTHAAYACTSSPYQEAVCAVVDGFGEGSSTAFYGLREGRLSRLAGSGATWDAPASVGMFYAMICALCGFDPMRGEEWKVMGLAPYGKVDDTLYRILRPLLRVDGLRIRQGVSRREYQSRLNEARAYAPNAGDVLACADVAATGQYIFSEHMAALLDNLHATGVAGSDTLILSGGCALNSVFNGQILERTPFRALHIPSAPADDGNAVGAAHLARLSHDPRCRLPTGQRSPYLGSTMDPEAIQRLLRFAGAAPGVTIEVEATNRRVAQLLAAGRVVAWVQGRAEFGPRALGNRSILADPRDSAMRDRINRDVKFREDFRPFGPAVLHEHGADYFVGYTFSPYMERAFKYRPEVTASVPAVVHVDGTGRPQSVNAELAPRLHDLLCRFHDLTGVPMLLNTSLNRMGKPIVHSVDDAVALFMSSAIDVLVIENVMLVKSCSAMTANH